MDTLRIRQSHQESVPVINVTSLFYQIGHSRQLFLCVNPLMSIDKFTRDKSSLLSTPICLVDKHVCVGNVSCFDCDDLGDFEDAGKSCRYADCD